MKFFSMAGAVLDRILGIGIFLSCVILVFQAVSVNLDIILRYVFNRPLAWGVEFNEYLLVFFTFLGTAWVLRREGHTRVDLLVNLLSPRARALFGAVTSLAAAIGVAVVVWYGVGVTWDHWQRGLRPSAGLFIPNAAILWIIPVGAFLLLAEFLRKAYQGVKTWREPRAPER